MATVDLGYTQEKKSTIRPELEEFNIEEDVISKAEDIYCQLGNPIRRNDRRRMMLLFCVYNAYKQLGVQKDPYDIGYIVSVGKDKVSRALKMFILDTSVETKRIDPSIFIDEYFDMTGLSEEVIPDVKRWMARIMSKDPSLAITIQPQRLAAVVLIYYMSTHGISYDIKQFETRLNIKENSIKTISKKIISIDNN